MGNASLLYAGLAAALFLATFGLYGIITAVATIVCLLFGFVSCRSSGVNDQESFCAGSSSSHIPADA